MTTILDNELNNQKDYKKTLSLPSTAFPMKANLAQRELQVLEHWKTIDLYGQLRQQGQEQARPRFVLHDGPPYANGRPHMGTALNKILKDVVVKSKTLSGYDAPFVPGWDCHGLPIELNVEKKHGKPGETLSIPAFRAACRAYAQQQVALQREDFQRLGVIADWAHPYLTMDFKYEADTVRALGKLVAHGHVHRGEKPVHWCMECGSALAEAEVEYRDKTSVSVYVCFDAVDASAVLKHFGVLCDVRVSVPIWTTTPWTLPANQAVCLHPDLAYALIQVSNTSTHAQRYFVVLETLVTALMQHWAVKAYNVCGVVKGAVLEGCMLQHPFLDYAVPIVLGEHVTTDAGTGNVHTAPAHGLEDYFLGKKYHLPLSSPVNARGIFVTATPVVGGMHVFKAHDAILAELAKRDKLLHHALFQHSYPHCWRHKTPLIFRATPQWFMSMEACHLRADALQAIQHTQWIPSWGESRIASMVTSRPDWCISRQRFWGIPLVLFVHKETGALHPNTPSIMETVACWIEKSGVEVWYEGDAANLLGEEASCYEKITDTLDVWFDSGVSHHCVLAQRAELNMPADLYFEGSDQHRGWFQSALLTAVGMGEKAPFKTVLTHGYVVDGKGLKMSKSLGNVVLPADVVKNFGADILRLWAVSVDHTGDMNFSDEILQRTVDAYRRIRNTARFFLSNLHDFDPETDRVPVQDMVELDRWAVFAAKALQEKMMVAYADYHFQFIYQLLHNFCSVEMGSFYLDIIKDRQYTSKHNSRARRSAQTALYDITEALVRWLAPILSFTAEEIWQQMPGQRGPSVLLSTFFENFPEISDPRNEDWHFLMRVRDTVNKSLEAKRHQKTIGSGLDAHVILYADAETAARLLRLGEELRFVLITSSAEVLPYAQRAIDADHAEWTELAIAVQPSKYEKCVRCWQRRPDRGVHAEHPALCGRCVENVEGVGEERYFA